MYKEINRNTSMDSPLILCLSFTFEYSTLNQDLQNRWEPVRFDRLLVKPVRPGTGLVRYETGPNSKFKFEFKKMKSS